MSKEKIYGYKILFHHGVGDCLRMLTEQPAINLHSKNNKIIIYYAYENFNTEDYQINYDPMSTLHWALIIHEILKNVDFFQLVGYENYESLDVVELSNWNRPRPLDEKTQLRNLYPDEYQGFDIPIDTESRNFLDKLLDIPISIAVQISGRWPTKNYDPEKYVKLFKLILEKYPNCNIFLFDDPGKTVDPRMLFDIRIVDLSQRLTGAPLIKLIQEVDYLICPDSYSKYLRNWAKGRQTVLCSQIHSGVVMPYTLLRHCFGPYNDLNSARLLFNPLVKILGAKYNNNLTHIDMVDNINEITPEEIINSIEIEK